MTGYPSTVLLLADYPEYRFKADIKFPIDFILSLGYVPYQVLKDIYERHRKPIYAVKGNHDGSMPPFVHNDHYTMMSMRT